MRRISSLSRAVAWDQVLPVLGVQVSGPLLPAVVRCPLCQSQRLWVYPDDTLGGQWHHCTGCGTYGDMIELAAYYWKLGLRSTLERLAVAGLPTAEPAEIDVYLGIRESIRQNAAWWAETRENYCNPSAVVRDLQAAINVTGQSARTCTPPSLVGAAPSTYLANLRFVHNKSGHHSMFRRRSWTDLLVIPFYDLPGRIASVWCAGDTTLDPVCRALHPYGVGGHKPDNSDEAGLAFLDAAMQPPHRTLGASVFAFSDILAALHLHTRWCRNNQSLLPIVACSTHDRLATKHTWRWLHPPALITWDNEMSPGVIRQAMLANASVSTFSCDPQYYHNLVKKTPHLDVLKMIKEEAVPWQQALRHKLTNVSLRTAEELLVAVGLRDEALHRFITDSEPRLRDTLSPMILRPRARRSGALEGVEVVEREGGWYRGKQLISDGIVRVHKIITVRDRTYYQGVVLLNDTETPFLERADYVDDKGMLRWASDYLLAKGVGVLTYTKGWERRSARELAFHFYKPKLVEGIAEAGWSAKVARFHLPQFSVGIGGDVRPDDNFIKPEAPGRHIQPPAPLDREVIAALSLDHEETRLFWSVLVSVLHNVIAPAVQRTPVPVVITGDGAFTVCRPVAAMLGCRVHEDKQPGPAALWPEYRTGLPKSEDLDSWLVSDAASNMLLAVPPLHAAVLTARGSASLIRCHRPLGVMQLIPNGSSGVLPAYLVDACRRKLWFEWRDTLLTTLWHDVADWFVRQGGERRGVMAAEKVWQLPAATPAANCLAEMVFHLLRQGELTPNRANFQKVSPQPAVVFFDEAKPGIWVPQTEVSRLVQKAVGLAPNLLGITESLSKTGALIEERIYHDERGWLLDEEWWNAGQRAWTRTVQSTGDLQ